MAKLGTILRYLLFSLLLLVLAGILVLQLPSVQTALTQKLVNVLEGKFDTDVKIGSLHFKPVNTVVLKDIDIIDINPPEGFTDTLAHFGTLSARFSLNSLITPGKDGIILKEVRIRDARLNLSREDNIYHTNLKRIFRNPWKPEAKYLPDKDIFLIKHVDIKHFRFTRKDLRDKGEKHPAGKLDFGDVEVNDMDLKAENFKLSHGIFSANVYESSFREKSGLQVTSITGKPAVGRGDTYIKDFRIVEGTSEISMDFDMKGKKSAFSNFLKEVVFNVDFGHSFISQETISHFSGKIIPDERAGITVGGGISGSVADIRFNRLMLAVENSVLSATVDGSAAGLPDLKNTRFDIRVSDSGISTAAIDRFVNNAIRGSRSGLRKFGKGRTYHLDLTASGDCTRATANLCLKQNNGGHLDISSEIHNLLSRNRPLNVKGEISSTRIDAGALIGKTTIGNLDFSTHLDITLPSGDNPIDARIDSLKIRNIRIKDYTYQDISGNAMLQDKDITADIQCRDRNLNANLAVWSDKYEYMAAVNVLYANLNAMNLDKREPSLASMKVYARADKDIKAKRGNARISDILLTNQDGTARVSDIAISSDSKDDQYAIDLESDFIKLDFDGNKEVMAAELTLYNEGSPLPFLKPGAYIEDGTGVRLQIDTSGFITGELSSGRIAINDNYLKNLKAVFSGTRDDLAAHITADAMTFKQVELDNNALDASMKDRKISVRLTSDNKSEPRNAADFSAEVLLGENKNISVNIQPSVFVLGSKRWELPSCSASKTGKEIRMDNFTLMSGDEIIRIDGIVSDKEEGCLSVSVRDFDLASVNNIAGQSMTLGGKLNVNGRLTSPLTDDTPELDIDIICDSLCVNKINAGQIKVGCNYDKIENDFDILISDILDGRRAMFIEGDYDYSKKSINVDAEFNNFPLNILQPALKRVASDIDGSMNGGFNVSGPVKELTISGNGVQLDGSATIIPTNVPYTFNGKFSITDSGLITDGFSIQDRRKHAANIVGGVRWQKLKNPVMDVNIDLNGLEILNTGSRMPNSSIYGHLAAAADISINGPFNDIEVNASVRNVGVGDIHAIASGKHSAAKNNLLTFTVPYQGAEDPYQKVLARYRAKQEEGKRLTLNADVNLDSGLHLFADLGNNAFSSGFEGTGNGIMNVKMNTNTGDYEILGDYTLTGGSFGVNAGNMIKRNFDIKEGSSIKFGGELMESTVNIDAAYQTKASIATLIADTTSISGRRIVNCGISVTNKISDPKIKFSIDIPDLDPSVKPRVESALSTEDKVQKQFLSLLLSNSFLPDEQGGIVNNNAMLYSNMSEIMANQVNNIFSRLDIPLDLGLNYQPSGKAGKSMFDVAISTQLFDNRVIIGGSLGNRNDLKSNNQTLVGDLDIQWKIIRSGALRLNLFSHSADQYTNYLDNSQRNGIGIIWQQEFNRFLDWIKMSFSGKERREALKVQELKDAKTTQKIILNE